MRRVLAIGIMIRIMRIQGGGYTGAEVLLELRGNGLQPEGRLVSRRLVTGRGL